MTTITSIDAQFTQAQIRKSSTGISESAANLSSGEKLNANVADLSVGTVLRTRVATLRTTVINAGQAKSLLSTAKGALETVGNLLQQQKSLAVKAADDSLTSNERGFLNQEFQAITAEIDRIAENTNFNGKSLIDGSISGQAALNSTTSEATENYSLLATTDLRLGGVVASGNLDSDVSATTGFDAVSFTSGQNVGIERTSASLVFTAGATAGAATITVAGQAIAFTAVASNATASATAFVTAARADQVANDTNLRSLVFIDNGNGTVTVKGSDTGTGSDALTLNYSSTAANVTVFLDGTDIDGAATALNANAGVQGTVRSSAGVTANEATINENLLGGLSNFSATVNTDGDIFTASFTVEVNGTTYTSQPVYLLDNGANQILQADQVITFTDPNGPVDGGGVLTDNSFNLVVDTDTTIAGNTTQAVQASLSTFADGLETQLAGAVFTQDRNPNLATTQNSSGNAIIDNAAGTVLAGIRGYDDNAVGSDVQGDVIFRTDGFGSDTNGSIGSVGSFSFNKDTGILTTTVDGVTYSADLSSTADTTGTTGQGYLSGGTAFDTDTGVFTTTGGTIVLATSDTTDGREIRIALGNVDAATTQIITDDAETEFANAFNSLFGVAANDSLSFQVGVASTDSIGVSINSAKTAALFKDDDGVTQSLSITTLADAQAASNVLDNAINTNISLIAEIDATITRFDSAIENNLTSIQNADAARSGLLDTDFSQESTTFAENTVRQDAAVSVLAQLNQRIQNLLQLLR